MEHTAAYISFMNWYKQNYAPYGEYDGINACYFCGKLLSPFAPLWVVDPDATAYIWFSVCSKDCKHRYNESLNNSAAIFDL